MSLVKVTPVRPVAAGESLEPTTWGDTPVAPLLYNLERGSLTNVSSATDAEHDYPAVWWCMIEILDEQGEVES